MRLATITIATALGFGAVSATTDGLAFGNHSGWEAISLYTVHSSIAFITGLGFIRPSSSPIHITTTSIRLMPSVITRPLPLVL